MSGDGVVQSFQRQVRRPAERRALPSPVITACHLSKEYRSTMGRRRTGCASTVTTVSREWQLQLAMRRKAHSRKPIAERSILRRVVLASGQSKGGLRAPPHIIVDVTCSTGLAESCHSQSSVSGRVLPDASSRTRRIAYRRNSAHFLNLCSHVSGPFGVSRLALQQ
jgi:hypothetical protein